MSQNQSNMFAVSMMDDSNRITYAYNQLDDSGNILKSNNRDTCVILSTNTEVANAINVIKNFINTRINPTASVTINYVDENNTPIINADKYTNLPLGNNTYTYRDLTYMGFKLTSSANYTVNLTSDNPLQVITFTYKKMTGIVTINYVDSSNNVIATQSVNSNLIFGQTYTYSPITITGYSTTETAQSVTISQNNLNTTITFTYTANA